jgi:hypothetical protein
MPVALMGFFTLQSVPLAEIGLPSGSPSHLDVTFSRIAASVQVLMPAPAERSPSWV